VYSPKEMKGNGLGPNKLLSRQIVGKWLSSDCTALSPLQRSAHMFTPGPSAGKPPINITNSSRNMHNKLINANPYCHQVSPKIIAKVANQTLWRWKI
jgi:hypothetical protein